MTDKNIVDQQYWNDSYVNYQFAIADVNDPVRRFIAEHIPAVNRHATCIEIGCFPGRYLAVMGELGYELHGIDLTPRIDPDLRNWLNVCNYKVGEILNLGIENLKLDQKHDVVCSFGFIEHFTNWESIIQKHLLLVADAGYLVITTPNFRGLVQRTFHQLVDEENLRRHVLESMHPEKWVSLAKSLGFETIFAGHFGDFDFWVDNQERSKLQKLILKGINSTSQIFRKMPSNNAMYSPYCGMVLKKI